MPRSILALALFTIMPCAHVAAADCSPALTNSACTVTLDADAPVSPLPLRLWPAAAATVTFLKNPLDDVVLEAEYKETEMADPFRAIFDKVLTPSLKSLQFLKAFAGPEMQMPKLKPIIEEIERLGAYQQEYAEDFARFDKAAKDAGKTLRSIRQLSAADLTPQKFKDGKEAFLDAVPSAPLPDNCDPAKIAICPLPFPRSLDFATAAVIRTLDGLRPELDIKLQTGIEALIDLLDANNKALAASLTTLADAQTALSSSAHVLRGIAGEDKDFRYQGEIKPRKAGPGVDQTATVKVTLVDKLSKSRKTIATVSVSWGGTRWEISGGAIFTMLADRNFPASPVIKDGVVTGSMLKETSASPTVVPMVFAHYRLVERAAAGRRVALLWSGSIGAPPASGSAAEFATGPSIAYRSLVISPVMHWGRERRLLPGYLPAQTFTNIPTVYTEKFWVRRFAIGIGIRIPVN